MDELDQARRGVAAQLASARAECKAEVENLMGEIAALRLELRRSARHPA
jgi:hypothetical protein